MKSSEKQKIILTLRHNVGIESDVQLAVDELVAICDLKDESAIKKIGSVKGLLTVLHDVGADALATRFMTHSLREAGTVAVVFSVDSVRYYERVVRDCAFGQDAIFIGSGRVALHDKMVRKLSRAFSWSGGAEGLRGITLASVLDYSTKMVFNRAKGQSVSVALDALVDYLLDEVEPGNGFFDPIKAAISAKKTTLYLTHELHLYKGKFFPRMVRSLINRYAYKPNSVIADPFVGSGTALLDASLLGHKAIGIDVDPTSVLISKEKLSPKDIDPALMQDTCLGIYEAVNGQEAASLFASSVFTLKGWKRFKVLAPEPMRGRLIKRGGEEGYDLLGEIENDSAKALCLISQVPEDVRSILRVCLSHALTKKLRLRFVGIGNGRFTIDVAKVGVLELFVKKAFHLVAITEVFAWLKRNGFTFGDTEVMRGSAKDFYELLGRKKVDLILTSPPYIPASSGREHYARARAIPLIFTGAASLEELDHLDEAFIGEMSAQNDTLHLEEAMPPAIRRTLKFLRNNEQRLPKYLPTLNYYVDLERVLVSTKKSLTDKGKALFVVGTSHTFYIHKTKEILHTVDAAKAIAELGEKVGLRVAEIINIPLKKSGGLNARPRSTDEYSETVVVFAKS